jgi:hypothetical protein
MSFSYSKVWDETVRTLRTHATLLIAVAGVFLFLPSLVAGYIAPPPQTQSVETMINHYRDNLWILFGAQLIGFIGNLALLILVLDDRRPTVGGSIAAALAMLPAYLLVSILSGFMLMIGFFLLILPFFYLIGRLAATGPALVAEGRRNPLDIIRRSFEITKGNGWAVVGLILLVFVAFYILTLAVTLVFGSILLIIDRATDGSVGAFLLLVLSSAIGAVFNTVLMVLVASIYRRLTGAAQPAAVPTSGI